MKRILSILRPRRTQERAQLALALDLLDQIWTRTDLVTKVVVAAYQARDTHYELACDHSEMAGHEVQEAREFGRVAAYDEVLAYLAAPEGE